MENCRILDAGCGTGEYIISLQETIPNSIFEGIELSKEKTLQLSYKVRNLKNVKIIQGSLAEFSGKESYDFIYCIDVLEHIEEDKRALINLCAALKHSGVLYIHVPRDIQKGFFRRYKDYVQDDHVRSGYELDELCQLLRNNGLQLVKTKFTIGPFVTFVWEIQKYIEDKLSRRISQLLCYPIVFTASLIDVHSHISEGNGIMVIGKKGTG